MNIQADPKPIKSQLAAIFTAVLLHLLIELLPPASMRKLYILLLAGLTACSITAKPTKIQPAAFDVPALVGKNIDQVQAILGRPESEDEPTNGKPCWERAFVRDTMLLTVRYVAATRRVVAFYISTRHGQTADSTALRALANLNGLHSSLVVKAYPWPSMSTSTLR
jgi:hypothetical protein